MGQLYADSIVLADWLLSPEKLHMALSRGWSAHLELEPSPWPLTDLVASFCAVYQEMSFGELDATAARILLNSCLVIPVGGDKNLLRRWAQLISDVAELMRRRNNQAPPEILTKYSGTHTALKGFSPDGSGRR